MRIWFSSLAAIGFLFAAHTVFAQNSADPNSLLIIGSGEYSVKGAEKIDAAEAWKLHQAGKLFVDARDETFYKFAHIEGAVQLYVLTTLTEDNLAKHTKKDQTVIFYGEAEGGTNPPSQAQRQLLGDISTFDILQAAQLPGKKPAIPLLSRKDSRF
jgi:hypothetical protein